MSIFTRLGRPEPTRREKAEILRGTIRNIDSAIQRHGRLPALLESLKIEQMILDGFIEGTCDENGFLI